MNQNIGSYLEALRLSFGYSLREAAKRSGLSHGYIRDVELGINRKNGTHIVPQPQTLRKFAEAYRADFNELMRISGHLASLKSDESTFEFVELDLVKVLFIQVDEGNCVNYHLPNDFFSEEKSLDEYMILEERLESSNFLRVQSGIYANLLHVRAFNENNGRIYFDDRMAGKYVQISWIRAQKYRNILKRAIAKNNNVDLVVKFENHPKLSMIIRNIVS